MNAPIARPHADAHTRIAWVCRSLAACLLAGASVSAFAIDVFVRTPDQVQWPADKKTHRIDMHADPAYRVVTRQVRIAPGTDLPPHTHQCGYRLATVVSGTLLLGFGDRFDEAKLKTLPAGSVFSEPAGHLHFARTLSEPVILQLTEVLTKAQAREAQVEAAVAGAKK